MTEGKDNPEQILNLGNVGPDRFVKEVLNTSDESLIAKKAMAERIDKAQSVKDASRSKSTLGDTWVNDFNQQVALNRPEVGKLKKRSSLRPAN